MSPGVVGADDREGESDDAEECEISEDWVVGATSLDVNASCVMESDELLASRGEVVRDSDAMGLLRYLNHG